MSRGGELRGGLLDARGGQPLAGVSVSSIGQDTFASGQTLDLLLGRGPRTDASGRFEVPRVAPDEGSLQLFDDDLDAQHKVASVAYELEPGAEKNLGTIYSVSVAKVSGRGRPLTKPRKKVASTRGSR